MADDKTKADPVLPTSRPAADKAANAPDASGPGPDGAPSNALTRPTPDTAEVEGGAYIRKDAVVNADGDPIEGLTVEGGRIVTAAGFKVKDGKVAKV